MTQPKPLVRDRFDPATAYPDEYQQGVDSANRLIDHAPPLFVRHALELVTEHMQTWPMAQKNGLTNRQWARSAGFAHTLHEHAQARAD